MRTIGNVLWFVFGGLWMGLGWWLAGLICAITIVRIPRDYANSALQIRAEKSATTDIVSAASLESAQKIAQFGRLKWLSQKHKTFG
jgi:uncharacterized membrane protein YccF (DUF307 family)